MEKKYYFLSVNAFLAACLGLSILFACNKNSGPTDPPIPQPSEFKGVNVYILFTGDLHEYSRNLPGLAHIIQSFRDTAAYVYVLNAGDFFMAHNTPYNVTRCSGQLDTGVPSDLKVPKNGDHQFDGLAMAEIIRYLNFDAIVIGNHDWKYGVELLKRPPFKGKLVGCNVGQPTKVAVDYLAFQSSGAHFILNVIGVANNSNPHPAPGETVNIYSITTTTTRNIITGRCAKGNINVLLTHLEDADDQWALDQLVERRGKACFDLLCGGHSHKKKSETINEAGYLKTGLFGTYIGIACIKWDTVLKSVAGKSFQLVCLENESPDPGMVSLIDSVKSVYPHQ